MTSNVTAWLVQRLNAARCDSEAHPEGHANRTFYAGQAIAYENVLSLLENEKPAAPRAERAAGTDRHPIATAPVNEEVYVYCGEMRFRAKLVPGASMTMDEEPCDQWQATREGEHPPCWSDGCCWASNEDENASLQPSHWSPAPTLTPES